MKNEHADSTQGFLELTVYLKRQDKFVGKREEIRSTPLFLFHRTEEKFSSSIVNLSGEGNKQVLVSTILLSINLSIQEWTIQGGESYCFLLENYYRLRDTIAETHPVRPYEKNNSNSQTNI